MFSKLKKNPFFWILCLVAVLTIYGFSCDMTVGDLAGQYRTRQVESDELCSIPSGTLIDLTVHGFVNSHTTGEALYDISINDGSCRLNFQRYDLKDFKRVK